jgi:hypothetical protein
MNWAVKTLCYFGFVAVDAWLVMFTLAAFDHPTAYWKCALAAYTIATVIGTGIYNGVVGTINMFKQEIESK